MQHLNVWPFGYQLCPDPPVNERCVCQKKKKISGEIKWLKMHPVTSADSPVAQPLKNKKSSVCTFFLLFDLLVWHLVKYSIWAEWQFSREVVKGEELAEMLYDDVVQMAHRHCVALADDCSFVTCSQHQNVLAPDPYRIENFKFRVCFNSNLSL